MAKNPDRSDDPGDRALVVHVLGVGRVLVATPAMSRLPPNQRFDVTQLRDVGGKPRSVLQITCGACKNTEVLAMGGQFMPTDVVERKFRQMHWYVGKSKSKDRCPSCVLAERRKPEPAPELPQIGEVLGAAQEAAQKEVEVGREITINDRRKIMDELEAAYDTQRRCYKAAGNDMMVAKKLDVPRQWVTEIREAFFGPEKNQAAEAARAELALWLPKLRKIEKDALATASEAEAARLKIEKLIGEAGD